MRLLSCCVKKTLCIVSSDYSLVTSKSPLTSPFASLYIQIQNIFSICDSISSSLLYNYSKVLLRIWQMQLDLVMELHFFCKDLLHIWQVFPLGNAVSKISRSKYKFFIKKECFFCFKPLFYSQS